MTEKARVAVLISGRGSNMSALLNAALQDGFPAQIPLVVSNIPEAEGLQFAAEAGAVTQVVSHAPFGRDRAGFENALHEVLRAHDIGFVCLAGFMRLLTASFVERWQGRILNIHPALLPSYRGLHTHARALADGVKIHGATVHFVVPEMDAGPIVMQGAVPVLGDDTEASLAARVLEVEHRIYPAALRRVVEGSVRLDGNRCLTLRAEAPPPAMIVPAETF